MSDYRIKPIQVMPYVAAYYDKHGLDTSDRLLLQALLQNPHVRFDKSIPEYFGTLVEWAPTVPRLWLLDYGGELTKTNARLFANYLSAKVREMFEICFKMELEYCRHLQARFSIKNCLQRVRDNVVGLDEDSLLLETIIKHIQRWCKRNQIDYKDLIKFDRNNVLAMSEQTAQNKVPKEYITMDEFCRKAGISNRHFRNVLKTELEVKRLGRELLVAV